VSNKHVFDDAQLLEPAGKAAFARGRAYHAEGRVRLSLQTPDALKAEALGSEVYTLWLKRDGGKWR